MVALTRYYLALFGHSQRYIPAVLAYLTLAAFLYSDPNSPVLPLYGVSSGGMLVVACWLTIALLDIEDPVQRLVTLSHARDWRRMIGSAVVTVFGGTLALTLITLIWSMIRILEFQPGAMAIGLVAHVAGALLGIAIALPCSRLLIARIGWTVLAATVTLVVVILAKIPLIHPLIQALTVGRPYTGPLLLAATTSVAALLISFVTVSFLVRRRA